MTGMKRKATSKSDGARPKIPKMDSTSKDKTSTKPTAAKRKHNDKGASQSNDSLVKRPKVAFKRSFEPLSDSGSSNESEEEFTGIDNTNTQDITQALQDDAGGLPLPVLSSRDTKLPTIARDEKTVARRLERAKKEKSEAGTIYVGRIPHGFYEDEMKAYFEQFGTVTKIRLSRNPKTGKCRHYGFVEFENRLVAEIVQDTMNNYLMMGRLLQVRLLDNDQLHPGIWKGANQKFRLPEGERKMKKAQSEASIIQLRHTRRSASLSRAKAILGFS